VNESVSGCRHNDRVAPNQVTTNQLVSSGKKLGQIDQAFSTAEKAKANQKLRTNQSEGIQKKENHYTDKEEWKLAGVGDRKSVHQIEGQNTTSETLAKECW
jgi:multidrug resistance efflux pump